MQHSTIAATAPALAQFDVDARELFEALAWLKKAAWHARSTFPILSCVRIAAHPNATITLECTDLDRTGAVTLAATVSSPGAVLVDRSTLADLAKRAGKGERVAIADNGNGRARVAAGKASAAVPTLPVADWPTMARKMADNPLALNMAADVFAADLARLSPAICKEETRYYLRGICFDVRDGELRLVATDGHRLSVIDRGRVDCPDMRPIVPDCAIQGIAPMLKGADVVSVVVHDTWGAAVAPGKRLLFKLIDGSFPDWRRVVPSLPADCPALHVSGAELAAHCATAAKGDKYRVLRIETGPDAIMAGQVRPAPHARPLSAIFDGPPIAFAFDAPVIEPFAKLSERLTFSAAAMVDGGGLSEPIGEPFLVLDPDAPHWTGVVMPMRTDEALPRPRAVEYVEAPAAPGRASDLFSVEPINGDRKLTGKGADKPRKATAGECEAYLLDYARRCGLPILDGHRLLGGEMPQGLVIGETRAPGYQVEAVYSDGAYCVPMPGRNQAPVTVQTLDDDGQWSDPMPCQDDKGKIAFPDAAKARRARKVTAPQQRAEMIPADDGSGFYQVNRGDYGSSVFFNPRDCDGVAQAGAMIAEPCKRTDDELASVIAAHSAQLAAVDPLEALTARLDAVEVAIERPRIRMKAIAARIDTPLSGEIEPCAIIPWPGARTRLAERDRADVESAAAARARRERIVRAYLAMRADRAALRREVEQLSAKRSRAVANARRHWKMRRVARGQYQRAEAQADREHEKRARAVLLARSLQKRLNAEHGLVDRANERRRNAEMALSDYRTSAAVQAERLATERDTAKRLLSDANERLAAVTRERDGQANAIAALAARIERVEAVKERLAA